jgi:light-regulated signal transduction histidine kinase (bacteriophytochrome)
LTRARERAADLPIVVLTGFDNESLALQALQGGAQDYLVKGKFDADVLSRSINYSIERNQIEATLRETVRELEVRTEEMEAFTYSVSHDLKEPLRTLEAFSQFLLEDYAGALDEQGRDYLDRISRASARLKDMIEELLVLSRLGRRPHALERIDVRATIAAIVAASNALIEEKGARIEVAAGLPDVLADGPRVEQIFGNLINNALKFNSDASPVVEVGVQEAGGGWATFYVCDNGIGIAPEYHDRIFGVFQRLHLREEYEGTGAGLAIVQRAAQALGGSVWLESRLGEGATFFVRLPLAPAGMAERTAVVVGDSIAAEGE